MVLFYRNVLICIECDGVQQSKIMWTRELSLSGPKGKKPWNPKVVTDHIICDGCQARRIALMPPRATNYWDNP
jgi:hypothetical protein